MKQKSLKYKYVLGTHIMFYEIEMVDMYVESIKQAIEIVKPRSRKNIIIEYQFNMSTALEKVEGGNTIAQLLFERCNVKFQELRNLGVNVRCRVVDGSELYTMIDYRRELNSKYCNDVDYVIWGETDCLAPRELFIALDDGMQLANDNGIYKYITTFATRKMWDDSWNDLEHPCFKNAIYHERDDIFKWENDTSSIHYTMNLIQMNVINDAHAWENDEFVGDYRIITHPKFDGSFLCISSELIKSGANIPPGFWGLSAEDTAFMYSCLRATMDLKTGRNDYKQIIIKNVLKVHNRSHPDKRNYALDVTGKRSSIQSSKGEWYNLMRDINKHNLERYISSQKPFITYDEYLYQLNKN